MIKSTIMKKSENINIQIDIKGCNTAQTEGEEKEMIDAKITEILVLFMIILHSKEMYRNRSDHYY